MSDEAKVPLPDLENGGQMVADAGALVPERSAARSRIGYGRSTDTPPTASTTAANPAKSIITRWLVAIPKDRHIASTTAWGPSSKVIATRLG